MIKNSDENVHYILKMVSALDKIRLYDFKKNLKMNSKLIVFILTRAYVRSDLFKNDWKEAIELNKDNKIDRTNTIFKIYTCFRYRRKVIYKLKGLTASLTNYG